MFGRGGCATGRRRPVAVSRFNLLRNAVPSEVARTTAPVTARATRAAVNLPRLEGSVVLRRAVSSVELWESDIFEVEQKESDADEAQEKSDAAAEEAEANPGDETAAEAADAAAEDAGEAAGEAVAEAGGTDMAVDVLVFVALCFL